MFRALSFTQVYRSTTEATLNGDITLLSGNTNILPHKIRAEGRDYFFTVNQSTKWHSHTFNIGYQQILPDKLDMLNNMLAPYNISGGLVSS